MTTYPDEPIAPELDPSTCKFNFPTHGLTKREYFAAIAMNGCLSNEAPDYEHLSPEGLATSAVKYADCLIKELNKKEENGSN